MGRGASYRPQYANNMVPSHLPRADVWRPCDDLDQYTGHGEYGSSKPQSHDAYATVDAWLSYREDQTTLSGQRHGPTWNPTASELSPVGALVSHLQLQSDPHFQPYEPLRFSKGISNAQLVKSFGSSIMNPSTTESRRGYSTAPTRQHEPSQSSSPGHPLPSVEHGADYALKSHPGVDGFRRNTTCSGTPRDTPKRTVSTPVAPEASEVYLAQARLPAVRRSTPKRCLVILDLNGTCIARPKLFEPKVFKVRPGIHKLFDYLFDHHVVMIFTSMHHNNAAAILAKLFTPSQRQKLAAFWARDKLGLTSEQLYTKTQTYKNLTSVWTDSAIQSTYPADQGRRGWDQSNTVLVDDSYVKAVSHPHNLLLVPEFAKKDAAKDKLHPAKERSEEAILQSLMLKLEELKYQTDVSRLILQWQMGKSQVPRQPRHGPIVDAKIEVKSEKHVQPLTPESAMDTSSEESQDDEVHLKLSAQMNTLANDEDRQQRGVSEVPDTVWADLLNGIHPISCEGAE